MEAVTTKEDLLEVCRLLTSRHQRFLGARKARTSPVVTTELRGNVIPSKSRVA